MTNPFPNLKNTTQRDAYQMASLFRETLRKADNGVGDLDKNDKAVQLQYDDVVLTARLSTDKTLETRHHGKSGTSISLAQLDNSIAYITTVSKASNGAYQGSRASAGYWSDYPCAYQGLSAEESEFLFSVHDAALRPAKA